MMGKRIGHQVWLADPAQSRPDFAINEITTLRSLGFYQVRTPEEPVTRLKELGPDGVLGPHPLFGGLEPDISWSSLRRFIQNTVLPQMEKAGLI